MSEPITIPSFLGGRLISRPPLTVPVCDKHDTPLDGAHCSLCILEGVTGREMRSIAKIMEGGLPRG